jgi:hypothetical protein
MWFKLKIICYLFNKLTANSLMDETAAFSENEEVHYNMLGRGSAGGIATRYRLDCPGIESR